MSRKIIKCEDFSWILIKKYLSILGVWPYEKKYNIKFILVLIITLWNSMTFIINIFQIENNILIKSSMMWPRFSINIIIELISLKANTNLGKILFNKMHSDLINLKKLSPTAKIIAKFYHKKIRRVLYALTFGFPLFGLVGLMYERISNVINSDKYTVFMFSAWSPISFDSSPNYEIIMLSQIFEILIGTLIFTIVNLYSGVFILHSCEQIEILCDDIKNYHDKFQHRTIVSKKIGNKIMIFNCLCLKCIVKRHNELINLVKQIDNYLHGMMLRQILTGTIDICSFGYETIENFHNESFAIFGQLIFLGITCLNFFILCWLGSELLEKNDNIGREIYNLNWYNFNNKNKLFIIMIINRIKRPMKITAAKYFTMSFELYKNWFMTSLEYLSVLAAVSSRS